MSKSTRNFKTIWESIEKFLVDVTRFALADAEDTIDDANFVFAIANLAILLLNKEILWMENDVLPTKRVQSLCKGLFTFANKVFQTDLNIAIAKIGKNYNSMMFKKALKTWFVYLQIARDQYKVSYGLGGMHRELLFRYTYNITRLITPICPHYTKYVWAEVLGKRELAIKVGFLVYEAPNLTLQWANKYLHCVIKDFKKVLQKQTDPPRKAKKIKRDINAPKPSHGLIFVKESYSGRQEECMKILKVKYNNETQTFARFEEIMTTLYNSPFTKMTDLKDILGECMSFIQLK